MRGFEVIVGGVLFHDEETSSPPDMPEPHRIGTYTALLHRRIPSRHRRLT